MNTQPSEKWKFAIGTTSRVPGSRGFHYLICDFDKQLPDNFDWLLHVWEIERAIIQRTPHGWHMYTNKIYSWEDLKHKLRECGADTAWIEIGERRGYYFLADKDMIVFPWNVEHMVITYAKKKAYNTKTS